MLFSNRKIIAIFRGKLIATEVYDPVTKKFGRTYEFGWQPETLDLTLAEVIKKFQSKQFWILVSDDLSYVVRLTIPSTVPKGGKRIYILDKLQEKIPEQVDDNEWDYKEIRGNTEEGHDILAFALVKSFATALFRSINKLGMDIVAIEPETIAKTRDANAYIGLSLKTDIKGQDEDVLNITPSQVVAETQKAKKDIPETEIPGDTKAENEGNYIKINKRLLLLFLIVLVLGLSAGGYLFYRSRTSTNPPKKSTTQTNIPEEATPNPSNSPEPSATPQPQAVDLSSLKVQLQNGSGIAGEAGSVQKILESEGFKLITSANADSFNHVESEVFLKPQYNQVYDTLDRALNSDYTLVKSETLADDSEFDLVIIIGKKK